MTDITKKLPDYLADIQVDLTKVLKYDAQLLDLTSVDVVSGPMFMRDFNIAYDKMAQIVSNITKMYEDAVENRKHEESKAILERAPEYFAKNDTMNGKLGDSAALRKTYVHLDEKYMKAKERENALKALLLYLDKKLDSFKMAHDDAKKIFDKFSSGPSGQTGYDGPKSGGR